MYKVGYIDDDRSMYDNYKIRLQRQGIELVYAEDCNSYDDILNWILHEVITCLLVDFKLTPKYAFNGTNIVVFINNQLPDLPCIILTNYKEDSINDNLVMKNLIEDRDVMRAKDISEFTEKIKQSCLVFANRLEIHQNEYDTLFRKKEYGEITSDEEELFSHLYRLLRAYGEVDDIPIEMLRPDIDKKMDTLIEKLDRYIDCRKR